jgi:hypothetical protein
MNTPTEALRENPNDQLSTNMILTVYQRFFHVAFSPGSFDNSLLCNRLRQSTEIGQHFRPPY